MFGFANSLPPLPECLPHSLLIHFPFILSLQIWNAFSFQVSKYYLYTYCIYPVAPLPTISHTSPLVCLNYQRLLASIIDERLHSLEETRGVLQAEIQENVAHGGVLEVLVRERCVPVELERYNLFIGDLERVVSLLLCLSARLARVQNALSTVDQHTDAEEMVRNQNFIWRPWGW